MAAILDLVNFHRFEELEKKAIPFFLITTMFQMGINKKSLLTNILHENTQGHILTWCRTRCRYFISGFRVKN